MCKIKVPEDAQVEKPEDGTGREGETAACWREESKKGGRRREVTGTPAPMADRSFCLHLSFPVTVPSSCFSGCNTDTQHFCLQRPKSSHFETYIQNSKRKNRKWWCSLVFRHCCPSSPFLFHRKKVSAVIQHWLVLINANADLHIHSQQRDRLMIDLFTAHATDSLRTPSAEV